jgi:hypothetical protein
VWLVVLVTMREIASSNRAGEIIGIAVRFPGNVVIGEYLAADNQADAARKLVDRSGDCDVGHGFQYHYTPNILREEWTVSCNGANNLGQPHLPI